MEYLLATSGGNDSIALMQLAYEKKLDFGCVYNKTGWARGDWEARIKGVADWCFNREIPFFQTEPARFENRHAKEFNPKPGFEELIAHNGGFPMPASKMQWCTMHLKEEPTAILLEKIDENADLIIVTGRRREESQNRAGLKQHEYDSVKHGGRDVWNPLFKHTEEMRDILIKAAGFEPLPHSSMECYPCVCANKADMLEMSNDPLAVPHIKRLKELELSLGHTRNGKPRVMFRPYRAGGAVGIDSVIEWSKVRGWTAKEVPEEYQIKGVDYSVFKGRMSVKEKTAFWLDIKNQCIALGYNMKDLHSDLAYDDTTKQGVQFARQCDGGYCGN